MRARILHESVYGTKSCRTTRLTYMRHNVVRVRPQGAQIIKSPINPQLTYHKKRVLSDTTVKVTTARSEEHLHFSSVLNGLLQLELTEMVSPCHQQHAYMHSSS